MTTIDAICVQIPGVSRPELERWIALAWVRPDSGPAGYLFREIDVARVRLIVELRDEMRVDDEALPLVLSLLDQLYDARREMRRVRDAILRVAPGEARERLLAEIAPAP